MKRNVWALNKLDPGATITAPCILGGMYCGCLSGTDQADCVFKIHQSYRGLAFIECKYLALQAIGRDASDDMQPVNITEFVFADDHPLYHPQPA
jgi:hypothetical protein